MHEAGLLTADDWAEYNCLKAAGKPPLQSEAAVVVVQRVAEKTLGLSPDIWQPERSAADSQSSAPPRDAETGMTPMLARVSIQPNQAASASGYGEPASDLYAIAVAADRARQLAQALDLTLERTTERLPNKED